MLGGTHGVVTHSVVADGVMVYSAFEGGVDWVVEDGVEISAIFAYFNDVQLDI